MLYKWSFNVIESECLGLAFKHLEVSGSERNTLTNSGFLQSFIFTIATLATELEEQWCNVGWSWSVFFCILFLTTSVREAGREAAWPNGLGHWIWNLEVPASNPPPYCYLDLISVILSSAPQLRCVNSQLASHQLGFLIVYVLFAIFSYLSPIFTTVLNTYHA